MPANLCSSTEEALSNKLEIDFHGWTDSTAALHLVTGKGNYKQFLHNKVNKIHKKDFNKWRYVSNDQNPADIVSRGVALLKRLQHIGGLDQNGTKVKTIGQQML